MTRFQLDQNANSKRFATDCHNEGLCDVFRWPRRLDGAQDPDFLPNLMKSDTPLVTFDHVIASEHSSEIPDQNSGIIIIHDIDSPNTLTRSRAQKILTKFKSVLCDWHKISWNNSIIEITFNSAELFKVTAGILETIQWFDLNDPETTTTLLGALQTNSE